MEENKNKVYSGADLKPTVEIKTTAGKVITTVGEGYYELYIDKAVQKAPYNYGTKEFTVTPGDHRISVYSAGRMIFDEIMHVPAEGEAVPETPPAAEEPAGTAEETAANPELPEPTEEPDHDVSVKASVIKDLIAEMRDIAAYLEGLLLVQPEQPEE